MLKKIMLQICQIDGCDNQARWSLEGIAICHEDLQIAAEMNSDNLYGFVPALYEDLLWVAVGQHVDGVQAWECTEEHKLKLKRIMRLLQDRKRLQEWITREVC